MFTNIYYIPPQIPRTLAEDIGAPELRHPMNYVRKADHMGFIKRLSTLVGSTRVTSTSTAGMCGQCAGKAMA